MSAESLAPPIYIVYHDKHTEEYVWGHLSADERSYYMRLITDSTTLQDDLEDLHLLQLRRFEAWQKDPGFDTEND